MSEKPPQIGDRVRLRQDQGGAACVVTALTWQTPRNHAARLVLTALRPREGEPPEEIACPADWFAAEP